MSRRNDFTAINFLLRLLFACLLVFVTFNPSGYSWVHWLSSDTPAVYKVASGVVLLIGWAMYLRATWHSLGPIGTVLAAAFFGVLIWLLVEWGMLSLESGSTMIWVVEVVVCGILAVGMSWSHIRRRLSGQYDTTEDAD